MKNVVIIIATLIWMCLIFFASSLPASETGPDTPLWTFVLKTLHFTNFGVLALLFLNILKGNRRLGETGPGVFVLSLLLALFYAISDEFHQKFTPGRHPSLKDILIDMMGASIFLGALFLMARRYAEKKLNSGRK